MIRVLIERQLIANADAIARDAFRELRHEALKKAGYISGETLRDASDPNHYVVISSWISVDHWRAWTSSDERREADELFAPLLAAPEKITVLESA
jgi:heme-degrading monooxygenase HmoA